MEDFCFYWNRLEAVRKFINFYDKIFQMLSVWNFWIKIVDWPQDQKPFSFQCMQRSRSETSQPILHNHIKSGFFDQHFQIMRVPLAYFGVSLNYVELYPWGDLGRDWLKWINLLSGSFFSRLGSNFRMGFKSWKDV